MSSVLRFTHSVTLLLSEPGTTDTAFLTYNPDLSRVRIDQSVLGTINGSPPPAGATRIIERSTDLIHWTTVRGGAETLLDPAAFTLDDFEFTENVQNTYRITVNVGGALYWTLRDQITVAIDKPWLKSISFPFLNQTIAGLSADPINRPSRAGVFSVVGRSRSVAVTDVRGGAQYNLTINTTVETERVAAQALFAPGDVVLLQVPPGYPIPGGYYSVGDTTEDRQGIPWDRRWWTLPLTEVAPSAADIVGATITWRGLSNRFASWDDLIAACATWRDVMALIGTPDDVVVP